VVVRQYLVKEVPGSTTYCCVDLAATPKEGEDCDVEVCLKIIQNSKGEQATASESTAPFLSFVPVPLFCFEPRAPSSPLPRFPGPVPGKNPNTSLENGEPICFH